MDSKNFLKKWDVMSKKHYNGEITGKEFKDQKLSLHCFSVGGRGLRFHMGKGIGIKSAILK